MSRVVLLLFAFLTSYLVQGQENKTEKIDALLQSFEKPNSPGLSIGIIQNGNIIYSKGIGLASVESNTKNNTNT